MALQKQPVNINFLKGLDTKTDSKQVQLGNFLALKNTTFDTLGRLSKRTGFERITTLPNTEQTTLATLNDNLLATGSSLYAYSANTDEWLNKGLVQPVDLSVQSLVRTNTSQIAPDTAISSNGLVCTVYTDNSVGYYQITDNTTGHQVKARAALPATANNPRVFTLGQYFVITFIATVAATPTLQYIAISINTPTNVTAAITISATASALTAGYDGHSVNDTLYLAWEGSGTTVRVAYMTSSLAVSTITSIASSAADLVSFTSDINNPMLWLTFWDSGSSDGFTIAYDYSLTELMAMTQTITNKDLRELTSVCVDRVCTLFYEIENVYSYTDAGGDDIISDYIESVTVSPPNTGVGTGTVGTPGVVLRSVGLASKAFIDDNGSTYMLAVYGPNDNTNPDDNSNQTTYFLIDSTGVIFMRLAYSNGYGYMATQVLPKVTSVDGVLHVPYIIKDFLATTNKRTNVPSGTPVNAIYTQTGLNMAKFSINTSGQYSSEIAKNLHLTGGKLWQYDGVKPVEHGFHVWPENVVGTTATGSGAIAAGTYFYVFIYEWTDGQGLLHRSAPSIPISVTTTTASSTNTLYVPTLRLTSKTSPNNVTIVGYRWSAAQPVYYMFTSLTSVQANDTTTDSVTFTDDSADASILGTPILYTTGGVIENICAPASAGSALFKNRLWIIDAEDRNLLWFSKQVIEGTPVEMSDLLTLYVAPTSGAQGSTGDVTAITAMDDKLIIFKRDAIYYLTGNGPDNTGAQNDFTDPVFITSSVGCDNPASIILMPQGIMFQSTKGIWLLDRGLNTKYIGDGVAAYNSFTVKSAESIPNTNQVRFILDDNETTLMYDYYVQQWNVHSNIRAIDSTLYQGLMTYLNDAGQVYQESANSYVDGSVPVLISFTTPWISVAGLQGYERFYFANLLGTYITPFKLDVSIAYDYLPSTRQQILVTPDNYTKKWGDEATWGDGSWGGVGNVFSARLFPEKQKCQTFQLTVQEVFDPSYGVAPGEGLSLSGLALTVGVKRGVRTQSARRSYG